MMTPPDAVADGGITPSLDDLVVLAQHLGAARRAVVCMVTAQVPSFHPPLGAEAVTPEETQALQRVLEGEQRVDAGDFLGVPLRSPEAPGALLGVLGVWGGADGPLLDRVVRQLTAHLELADRGAIPRQDAALVVDVPGLHERQRDALGRAQGELARRIAHPTPSAAHAGGRLPVL